VGRTICSTISGTLDADVRDVGHNWNGSRRTGQGGLV
jgi:hypothetical protein